MKNNILLVLLFFLIPITINGQTQEATTSYGKKVILNADGTWKYAEEATTIDGKKVLLNADGTWKYAEKGTSSNGEGIAGGPGNQGDPNGSINSKVRGTGSGLGTQGTGAGGPEGKGCISYSLQGRGPLDIPRPKYDYQVEGKVVVEVSVDRSGDVVTATPGIKGSTTLDDYLLKVAKEAAMKARFEVKQDAPALQKGTITYNFVLK
jgi:TonB family protein